MDRGMVRSDDPRTFGLKRTRSKAEMYELDMQSQQEGDRGHTGGPLGLPPDMTPMTPMFTEADEMRESATLTPQEAAAKTADLYGLADSLSNCRISEDDCLPEALYLLDKELDTIPTERKAAFLEAQHKCPTLVSDSHKEAFLWTENLDAKLAAERLVNYWEFRHELFGPEKCFLPMTLQGAMRDDHEAVTALRTHILPVKDNAGRAIAFPQLPLDFSRTDHKGLARALMYTFHAAIEDTEVQKRGIILLAHFREAWTPHIERPRFLSVGARLIHCFPLRIRAMHVVHPGLAFRLFIWGTVKFLMGKSLRQRYQIHDGSVEDALRSLEGFGFTRDQLPSELGGTIILPDLKAWMKSRMALEGHSAPETLEGAPPSLTSATTPKRRFMKRAFETTTQENPILSLLDTSLAATLSHDDKFSMLQGMPTMNARKEKRTTAPVVVQPPADRTKNAPKKALSRAGRMGDPRMNRAVKAKMDHPETSLTDALLQGGFVFPEINQPFVTNKSLFDTDNVTMHQRKNQLLRRLRKKERAMAMGNGSTMTMGATIF